MSEIISKAPESRKERLASGAKKVGGIAAFGLLAAAVVGGPVYLSYKDSEERRETNQRLIDEKNEQLEAYETLNQAGVRFSGVETIAGTVVVDLINESDPSCTIGFGYSEDSRTGDWELSLPLKDLGGKEFDTERAHSAVEVQDALGKLCPEPAK